ncbi:SDR family NAD(P)-dependent oxidoreductase [Ideonella livida]|uniref:SDR family oxidoreductase n=1 Tax=Ideonella livida TaxID=2707176 RepID=A0A7C9TMB9_9BURK|nr:SDR family oxidoreductase [Ideonella livida]NDY93838.1 SDR family oxidoreductase [Ideonella livida]
MTAPTPPFSVATPGRRTALITGAAGGLGEAFALRLAALGHALVLTDRADCTPLASHLEKQGTRVTVIPADLGDAADVQRLAAAARDWAGAQAGGGVDVLVNNAAFMPQVPLAGLTPALWRQIMAVNVDAPLLLAQALAPAMAAQGWGRIVNLASSTVWGPPPGMSAYATSKMAVIGLTRALASELGDQGITVNAISPGLTRHPGSAAHLPEAAFEGVRQRQFIPRTEVPEDLTGALAFLVSDDARFYTGQVMNVDGGGFGF